MTKTNIVKKNKNNMENILYKIATQISGFSFDLLEIGAREDFYYDDCKSESEKLDQIFGISDYLEFTIIKEEAMRIMKVLDSDHDCANDVDHDYMSLQD